MSEKTIGDMKQGLTSGARVKLTLLPRAAAVHTVRAIEYGADKYARGNYHGPVPAGVSPVERLLGYIDATQRHLMRVSDAINRALGTGGDVVAACQTRDEDGGGKFPASSLPDLSHALASLGIGISCAVDDGLLPADPGRPWDAALASSEWAHVRKTGAPAIPQKDDPASEHARCQQEVEALEPIGGAAADLCPGESDMLPAAVPKTPAEIVVGSRVRVVSVTIYHGREGVVDVIDGVYASVRFPTQRGRWFYLASLERVG